MEGWIKIHRKLIEWEWHDIPEMMSLLLHLLLLANHEDKVWHGETILRGQLVTGRKELSRMTGISEQSIRTYINRLKSTNEITIKSTNKFSVITICNYDKYQIVEDARQPTNQPSIQPTTNQQLTSNQPATNHKQECKNEKNIIVDVVNNAREELLGLGDVWRKGVLREIYRHTQRMATAEELAAYIDAYADNLVMQGVGAGEEINHRQRFVNWLRIRLQVEQRQKQQQAAQRRSDEPWKRDDRGKVYKKF